MFTKNEKTQKFTSICATTFLSIALILTSVLPQSYIGGESLYPEATVRSENAISSDTLNTSSISENQIQSATVAELTQSIAAYVNAVTDAKLSAMVEETESPTTEEVEQPATEEEGDSSETGQAESEDPALSDEDDPNE